MKNLKQYVEQKNRWSVLLGKTPIDVNKLTAAEAHWLLDSIECDLSPENLTCDGELRGMELRRKQRMLTEARDELEAIFG
jgi:hypothetical protein